MDFVIAKDFDKEFVAKRQIMCRKIMTLRWNDNEDILRLLSYATKHEYARISKNMLCIPEIKQIELVPQGETIKKGYHCYLGNYLFYNTKIEEQIIKMIVLSQCIVPQGGRYYINPYENKIVASEISELRIYTKAHSVITVEDFLTKVHEQLTLEGEKHGRKRK